jgi:hypothetical protein
MRLRSRSFCAALLLLVSPPAFAQLPAGGGGDPTAALGGCDPLDPAHCLLPFPNDWFTIEDALLPSGRRVALLPTQMPRNAAGKPIDPTPWDFNDGFSPGALIVVKVPGLDVPAAFEQSGIAPITDVARSLDPSAPVQILDAESARPQLAFAELDRADDLASPEAGEAGGSDPQPPSPADTTLLIRPARNLLEGRRYVVVLRDLVDADGAPIEAREPYRSCRDRAPLADPLLQARCDELRTDVFPVLERAGIDPRRTYLAWDFTVASAENLAGRMLHIRDDAFAQLGDVDLANRTVEGDAPAFVVTAIEDFLPCGDDGCQDGEDARIARRVEGRVLVPCYLNAPGCPSGSRFALDPLSGLPQAIPGNQSPANFVCNLPHSVVSGDLDGSVAPGHPTIVGHGLFGDATTVDSGKFKDMMRDYGFVMCATDFIGMAFEDIPYSVSMLSDLSLFPGLADRVQQGMLNFLFLGRAMIHPAGLNGDPAFQFGGEGVFETGELYYTGGSQGGIIGGSLTAVAPDFRFGALGVPGMNYSMLLRRSVDFDIFAEVLYRAYPDELERPLLISLIQMLWDRAESNGYAHHMTDDPYPNTPPHEVYLFPAFGDHQVTMWSAEVMARTVGASIHSPVMDAGRHPDVHPYFAIPRVAYDGSGEFHGSSIVVWDIGPCRDPDGTLTDPAVRCTRGTTPPPTTNNPNRVGQDPHGPDASDLPEGQLNTVLFMLEGKIRDVCGGEPCYLTDWNGPGAGAPPPVD